MKYLIFLLYIMLFHTVVYGQNTSPKVLSSAMPSVGFSAGSLIFPIENPDFEWQMTQMGENMNWVVSSEDIAASEGESEESTFLAADQTPYKHFFPTATLAETNDKADFTYYYKGENEWQLLGRIHIPEGKDYFHIERYSNDHTFFPLEYGQKWTATNRKTIEVHYLDGVVKPEWFTSRLIKGRYSVCGYGTLQLPHGTFNDVLCIKSESLTKDTTLFDEEIIYENRKETIYTWYNSETPLELFSVYIIEKEEDGKKTRFVGGEYNIVREKSPLNNRKCYRFKAQLFPNPLQANEMLLEYELLGPQEIVIGIFNEEEEELSLITCKDTKAGKNRVSLKTADLPQGLYYIKIADDTDTEELRWIK